jgi:uncharacterized NAD(P)/FAD-binding protein YdhS
MSASRVVIIGGGASGACVAIQLLQATGDECTVTVIEPRAHLGEGVAYSTVDDDHRLNVAAVGMSCRDDAPDDFVHWAGCNPGDFLPRYRYAQYLQARLDAPTFRHRLEHVRDTVTYIDPVTRNVKTSHGRTIAADAVVLALGNAAPTPPTWLADIDPARVIVDPWAPDALTSVCAGQRVLCVGTGLTFVDVSLMLARNSVEVVGVSRHGLLPTEHAPMGEPPHVADFSTALDVLRWLREQSDWRAAFAALRPRTPDIWLSLSNEQQSRFLRHARRYWDVHRHRIPPEVAAKLRDFMNSGSVSVVRGDAHRLAGDMRFDAVVLCTGPDDSALRRTTPLDSLIASGHASIGPHGIGVATATHTGALIDANGRIVEWMFAIGPLRRGTLWESTAMPEIRAQAAALAHHLVR